MTRGTNGAPAAWDQELRRPSLGYPEDGPLVAGLRAGDEAAFVALLRRHQTPMLRIARTYVMNQATAEDVVQDTWLVVLNGVNRFEGRSSLKTWIYRILTNRAKTAGQRERRCVADSASARREIEAAEAGTPAGRFRPEREIERSRYWMRPPAPRVQSVDDALVTSERVAFVVTAINLLPLVQRLVITLRDVECWTATEVCNALELSQTNQRVLLHRARSKVRMGTAFVEPPGAA